MQCCIVIPAAGSGQRFGGELPKQYRLLGGIPVIVRAMSSLLAVCERSPVVVAVDARWVRYAEKLFADFGCAERVEFVEGGSTRQESVRIALEHPTARSVQFVVVHDAVRPFTSEAMVRRVIEAAERNGAAVPIIPPKDTVKLIDDSSRIEATLPRARIGMAQTPQVFERAIIWEAHCEAVRDRFSATDDASIVEYAGYPVVTVEGEETNIKITTPLDWLLAERLLTLESS
jgi:2-C-methyl-D-erythritol 4-phosphate cytidylyltransferase